jgi:serine/threonine protein kinase/Tfp pilus assembly protein PilF
MSFELKNNTIVTHYKIIEKIGAGGMGVVYKAQDTKLDRLVALKFLPKQFSINEEEKKRFIHEAKAAAALNHVNIVTIHEINEFEDQTYIVMEYLEGETIKDKIERRGEVTSPLPLNKAINTAIQIAEGLDKAHKMDIVHRDIKSANIMISDDGVVRILDFGLAKLRGRTKLTKEGTTLGTVAYMSPEQASGEKVDHRSDIWSLGVVLYEMLTGQIPFRGEYDQAIMYAIMNEEQEPITGLRTGVPLELERILNKSLAKDPRERYQTTADLLVDLRKAKKDSQPEITAAKIKTKPETVFKLPSKLVLPGGVLLLVIIFIVVYFIFKGKPEPEIPPVEPGKMPSLAIAYFVNNSGDENLDNWRHAFSELLTTDLAQSKYIKVLRSDEIYGIFKKLNLLEARRYSDQDLKEVARIGKVNHVLKGSYIKAGDNFVITAMLINASSGETISSLSVRAENEQDIFSKTDELTRQIKSKLKLTDNQIAGDVDREVGQIITSSPEAFEYYLQAWKCFNKAEYHKTIELLEKALKMDSEFAFAYRNMAFAYARLGYGSKYRECMEKAMKFSHRLPDRERYIIEARYYKQSEETWDKAILAYQKVLQLYPLDLRVNGLLGYLYMELEEWDKAIERTELLIRHDPEDYDPYNYLALCYQAKGDYEKAGKLIEFYLNRYQDHWQNRSFLAANFYIQKKFHRALMEVDKAISLAPEQKDLQRIKGDICFYQGHFSEAEMNYRKLLESPVDLDPLRALYLLGYTYLTQGRLKEAETYFRQALKRAKEYKWEYWDFFIADTVGYIYFLRGQFEKCLKEFNRGVVNRKESYLLGIQPRALYFTALVYLEKKSWARAERVEAELLEWANKRKNKKFIRWYYLFRGHKEVKKKNPSGAIEYLNRAVSLLYHECGTGFDYAYPPLFFETLARAYLESGNLEKAKDLFEKITDLTHGRFQTGDIYARAFYQLGKIFQRQGKKDKAIEHYKQFIELWKNCDPIFQPLVENARKKEKECRGRF